MKCPEDPLKLVGQPIGMYHCPSCGCMQVAAMPHVCDPDACLLDNCDCRPRRAATKSCPSCNADAALGRLSAREVWAEEHVLIMGEIRNACRDGYSFDRTTLITPDRQRSWWTSVREHAHAWLIYDIGGAVPDRLVGYGLLRPVDPEACGSSPPHLTTSVGIFPSARGQRFGRAVMRFMVHYAQGCLGAPGPWSLAAIDNPSAVKLHDADHWTEIQSPEPERLRAFEARRR